MQVSNYNAKDWAVTVDGMHITQLGEDGFTADKDEENFETSVGCQGDVVVSKVNNTLGTFTLSVQATCPQLGYLLSLGDREVSVWAENLVLGQRAGGSKAKLKKIPEITGGSSAEDRSFEFQVFDYVHEAI